MLQIEKIGTSGPFTFAGGRFPGEGGSCAANLAPRASCLITIEFAPPKEGPHTGSLKLVLKHEGDPPRTETIQLTADGVAPAIALAHAPNSRLALTALLATSRLDSLDTTNGTEATLGSLLLPGLSATWHAGAGSVLCPFAGARVRRMSFATGLGKPLDPSARWLWEVGAGTEVTPGNHRFVTFAVSLGLGTEGIVTGTSQSALTLDAFTVPRVRLRGRYSVWDEGPYHLALELGGAFLLSAARGAHRLDNGLELEATLVGRWRPSSAPDSRAPAFRAALGVERQRLNTNFVGQSVLRLGLEVGLELALGGP